MTGGPRSACWHRATYSLSPGPSSFISCSVSSEMESQVLAVFHKWWALQLLPPAPHLRSSSVRMCDAVPKSQVHSQLVKLLPKPQRPGLPCCSEVTSSSWSLRLPFSLWPSPQKATALFHWLWQAHFFPLVLILIHLEFRLSFHVPTPTPESCFKCTLPLKSPPQTSISRQIAWSPDSKALNICLKGEVWNP